MNFVIQRNHDSAKPNQRLRIVDFDVGSTMSAKVGVGEYSLLKFYPTRLGVLFYYQY